MRIRPFEEADRAACQRIAAAAALSSYGARMPDLAERFAPDAPLEPAEVRLVAAVGDEPAGFVELVGAHVANLFVAPERQGRGIGSALMAAAEAGVVGDLTLSVFTVNPEARRLYERLGFAVEAVRTVPFAGATREVWRMRKTRPTPPSGPRPSSGQTD